MVLPVAVPRTNHIAVVGPRRMEHRRSLDVGTRAGVAAAVKLVHRGAVRACRRGRHDVLSGHVQIVADERHRAADRDRQVGRILLLLLGANAARRTRRVRMRRRSLETPEQILRHAVRGERRRVRRIGHRRIHIDRVSPNETLGRIGREQACARIRRAQDDRPIDQERREYELGARRRGSEVAREYAHLIEIEHRIAGCRSADHAADRLVEALVVPDRHQLAAGERERRHELVPASMIERRGGAGLLVEKRDGVVDGPVVDP